LIFLLIVTEIELQAFFEYLIAEECLKGCIFYAARSLAKHIFLLPGFEINQPIVNILPLYTFVSTEISPGT
jgi:hypothetical protein